jgi:hypothetical protein
LGGDLRRLAPALRRAGVNVELPEKKISAGQPVTLERIGPPRSQCSQQSPEPPDAGPDGDRRDRGDRVPQPCSNGQALPSSGGYVAPDLTADDAAALDAFDRMCP